MNITKILVGMGLLGMAGATSVAGCGGEDSQSTTGQTAADCAQTDPLCSVGECVALADNSGQTKFGLRMSQLTVTRPEVLTSLTVGKIVSDGVRLNLLDCRLNGQGTFNWLLELDTQAGTLRTGGALPEQDPTGGYCFVNSATGDFQVEPVTVPAPVVDGAFSAEVGDILVPIYLQIEPPGTPIILPLKAGRITDAKISTDNNCIGKYNSEGLLPTDRCLPSPEYPAFVDGASLDGYITLEEADKVIVEDVGQSLCVLLAGPDPDGMYHDGGSPKRCKRDANQAIVLQGDWCSTTNSAATAGCADSFALGATFAASAVTIKPDVCP